MTVISPRKNSFSHSPSQEIMYTQMNNKTALVFIKNSLERFRDKYTYLTSEIVFDVRLVSAETGRDFFASFFVSPNEVYEGEYFIDILRWLQSFVDLSRPIQTDVVRWKAASVKHVIK